MYTWNSAHMCTQLYQISPFNWILFSCYHGSWHTGLTLYILTLIKRSLWLISTAVPVSEKIASEYRTAGFLTKWLSCYYCWLSGSGPSSLAGHFTVFMEHMIANTPTYDNFTHSTLVGHHRTTTSWLGWMEAGCARIDDATDRQRELQDAAVVGG